MITVLMNKLFLKIYNIIATKHYRDVMRIIDDLNGKYLYEDLEKSYSDFLLQTKNTYTVKV